jgi:hypothetical protein
VRKLVKEAANADWFVGSDLVAGTGAEKVVMVVVVLLLSLAIGIAVEQSGIVSAVRVVLTKSRRI